MRMTMSRDRFTPWALATMLLCSGACCAAALAQNETLAGPVAPPDIRSRLDAMMKELERQRMEYHVPGVGIAVVYDGEIILCDGLGEADIEHHTEATGDTIFAIGSSTKAFTATAIGMLVDAGKMDWDASVHTYLPDFHLFDKDADEKITIRDLACHRSGLSRMGLLWAAGTLSRDEILDAVVNAEPIHKLGEAFNYSNINFIAAGDAAGKAFGSDWESLIRAKILVPLHMDHTTLSITDAHLATGYTWDDVEEKFEVDPARRIDAAGPAGAINSSARDMANWLRFQLAHGEFDGQRLISNEQIDETHTPQIEMGGGVSYGFGWMIHDYEGQTLIEHGGNIDGFSAMVAFIPEAKLGYVLFCNSSVAKLQGTGDGIVFGTLLGDGKPDESAAPKENFEPYLGKYIANFGPFNDDRITAVMKDGKLAVDVPGQMVYELKPPSEDGKREFALTNQIAIDFVRDDEGDVTGMRMYQSGLTFELPREGVTITPEVALDDVRDYLGTYHFDEQNKDMEVVIQNGRLAVDVPGQMVFEMHAPDDEDKWVFRATEDIAVSFNRDDDGAVKSMTMFQAGKEMEMPKTAAPDPTQVVTLADVMELHGKAFGTANMNNVKNVRATGTINFVNQGVTGTVSIVMQGLDHYRNDIDLGRSGFITVVVAGDRGWTTSSFDPKEELKGKYLTAASRQSLIALAADWRSIADKVTYEGLKTLDARPHYVVHSKVAEGFQSTSYIDVATGFVTKDDVIIAAKSVGALPMQVRYKDYRRVGGIMLPYHIETTNDAQGKAVMEFDSMEANVDLPADALAEPGDGDPRPKKGR